MVDLFCHNLGAIKTHTLRWSLAKIEPMEKKTKSVIGIVIIIVGLIAYNYFEYTRYCENWLYIFKPWC